MMLQFQDFFGGYCDGVKAVLTAFWPVGPHLNQMFLILKGKCGPLSEHLNPGCELSLSQNASQILFNPNGTSFPSHDIAGWNFPVLSLPLLNCPSMTVRDKTVGKELALWFSRASPFVFPKNTILVETLKAAVWFLLVFIS